MRQFSILMIHNLRRAAKLSLLLIILVGLVPVLGQKASRKSQLKIIQLAEPKLTGPVSFEQVLAKRRSVREFTNQKLDFIQIGQLAWAGQGITDKQTGFRTAPSAGAIYPMKLYFATQEGTFIYNPESHSLEEILNQDVRGDLSKAASGQQSVANAACDIIIAGSVRKVAAKYENKGRGFMLLEAGHIAQNIQLQAVSLGLGAVPVGAFDIRSVSKVCRLTLELEPVYIICVGYPAVPVVMEKMEEKKETQQMEGTKAKKAVLIVASSNFRDEELFKTRHELDKAGVETVVASSQTGTIKGMLGGKAEAEILVNDVNVNDYDAIIFIGGSGAREYFDNQDALNIAQQAVEKGKIVAAICIAPAILANAGVLDGIKATSFSTERLKLKKGGADFTGADVEQDGLIITGSGPEAAAKFGKTIAETLTDK